MEPITKYEHMRVYDFWVRYRRMHGFSPTEVAAARQIDPKRPMSPSVMGHHVRKLGQMGWLMKAGLAPHHKNKQRWVPTKEAVLLRRMSDVIGVLERAAADDPIALDLLVRAGYREGGVNPPVTSSLPVPP